MGKPIYIKHCCYFCTEREVNCKGCATAKAGIDEIKKKCQKYLDAGICTETFGDTVNKNLCFTPDDRDIEELEGKSTSALSVNNKEEKKEKDKAELIDANKPISKPEKPPIQKLGEGEEPKQKVNVEVRTIKLTEALKEAAVKGDIDIKLLLEKLGKKE